MNTRTSVGQCALRIGIAAWLAFTVFRAVTRAHPFPASWTISQPEAMACAILSAMLTIVAIWLVLGIRTQTVALIGVSLHFGLTVVQPGFHRLDQTTLIEAAVLLALALPLIALGGGRYSICGERRRDPT